MTQACGSCKFFMRGSEDGGWCRRNPPIPIMTGMRSDQASGQVFPAILTFFPEAHQDAWCGEWKKGQPAKLDADAAKLASEPAAGSA